jgi:Domain of unknown function (DUF4281)
MMSPNLVFSIANFVALCGWLTLAVLPGKKWVTSVIAGIAIPAVLAAVYTVIIALTFFSAEGGFSSLSDVARLFSNPWLLLAGWIHYLAFDLLVGTWEARALSRLTVSRVDVLVRACRLVAVSGRAIAVRARQATSVAGSGFLTSMLMRFPIFVWVFTSVPAGSSRTLCDPRLGRRTRHGFSSDTASTTTPFLSKASMSMANRMKNMWTPLQGAIRSASPGSRWLRPRRPRRRSARVDAIVTRSATTAPVSISRATKI